MTDIEQKAAADVAAIKAEGSKVLAAVKKYGPYLIGLIVGLVAGHIL